MLVLFALVTSIAFRQCGNYRLALLSPLVVGLKVEWNWSSYHGDNGKQIWVLMENQGHLLPVLITHSAFELLGNLFGLINH